MCIQVFSPVIYFILSVDFSSKAISNCISGSGGYSNKSDTLTIKSDTKHNVPQAYPYLSTESNRKGSKSKRVEIRFKMFPMTEFELVSFKLLARSPIQFTNCGCEY